MSKITRRSKPAKRQAKSQAKNRGKARKVSKKSSRKTVAKPQRARGIAKKQKPWTAAEIHEAFSRFRNANPEPKGELEHLNPFTLLVAVVLSAQAT